MLRASILVPVLAALTAVCAVAEEAGKPLPGTRTLEPFSELVLDGPYDVHVRFTLDGTPVLSAEEAALPRVLTRHSGERLELAAERGLPPEKDTTVRLAVPLLRAVSTHGSGDVVIEGFRAELLRIRIDGSGGVTVEGECGALEVEIEGSGDVDARRLRARTAKVHVDGSGDTYVAASEALSVRIEGSGDVHTFGKPAKIERVVDGSGEILEGGPPPQAGDGGR